MTKLLVADDDVDVRDFLKEELSKAGFTVVVVGNGADAVVAVAEQAIDLIVLDMLMPGLDGIQVIRVLRKITPNIPIIGLTGYVGRGFMSQALELGVHILGKPVVIPELIKEINQALANKKN
ncbi:MAG TPA: response regulator [Anaerolineaceae bacterium]|nr:response regulator [Anaerolineaceae bacterium]HPN52791.1 response regulator [Anaerolineaceae bacterium]